MAKQKLSSLAFGYSLAIVSALCMLLLGILGNLGIYTSAVEQMQKWHMFFDLNLFGIITGIIEAAIIGFVFGWLIAYFYNRLA